MTTARKRVDRGIYLVSPGVYELVVSAGKDPKTGTYRQTWRRHHGSITSAREARRVLLAQAKTGELAGSQGTVDELFDLWLADLERLGRAPKTIKGYRDDARAYWRPAIGGQKVHKVQLRDLRVVLDGLIDRGLSTETIRHVRACVSGAFSWAMREEWITRDPTKLLQVPTATRKRPTVPTPDEVVRLLAAARTSARPEMERVVWLGAITGARNSEIRGWRIVDFDLANGTATIERALSSEQVWATKNRQIRDVSLGQATVDVVVKQIDHMKTEAAADGATLSPDAYLFSDRPRGDKPWREDIITDAFRKIADAADCPHLTFKHLRKFMSTYGRELGFTNEAVSDRAGHDPAVAEKHYRGATKAATDLLLAVALEEQIGGASAV